MTPADWREFIQQVAVAERKRTNRAIARAIAAERKRVLECVEAAKCQVGGVGKAALVVLEMELRR